MKAKPRTIALRLTALVCLAALILVGPPVAARAAWSSGGFSFPVKGNAAVFKYDAQTRTLKLGQCLVVNAQAYRTRGALRPEHQTAETMQRLFDALLAAEIVDLDKAELAQIKAEHTDPFEYGGLELYFTSPNDPNKYGRITFNILDAAQPAVRQDVASVYLYVYNQRKSDYQYYAQSAPLCALIRELAAESYRPTDLAAAESVLMSRGGYVNLTATDHETYETQDRAAIVQLAAVFETAEPYPDRVGLSDSCLMFRFTLPQGDTLHAYIAPAYPDEDLEHLTFLRTGDALYTLDRPSLNAALKAANLPEIGDTWRAFHDADWPLRER